MGFFLCSNGARIPETSNQRNCKDSSIEHIGKQKEVIVRRIHHQRWGRESCNHVAGYCDSKRQKNIYCANDPREIGHHSLQALGLRNPPLLSSNSGPKASRISSNSFTVVGYEFRRSPSRATSLPALRLVCPPSAPTPDNSLNWLDKSMAPIPP